VLQRFRFYDTVQNIGFHASNLRYRVSRASFFEPGSLYGSAAL